jgi:ABC-type polysaccharide/polyol phosphate transport system ATPase subunit
LCPAKPAGHGAQIRAQGAISLNRRATLATCGATLALDAALEHRTSMSRQFIYHMRGLSKTYPGGKQILNNIHLQFYPDAKIGVLGVNGAGKSTLLKIMAGMDKEWTGEAWVAEGARVGYLPQEPKLDETKTVRENVMEGVAAQQAVLDRYN